MQRKIAFMFPGQGAQYAGMGHDLCRNFPIAKEVYREADNTLGFSLSKLCFEGPEEELKLTENTQPSVLTTTIATYKLLEDRGIRPDFVVGHSLGEYSALVAAGALPFSSAVSLVRRRGQYMQEAVPVGEGAMAAIIGLKKDQVEEVCLTASNGQTLSSANLNSLTQIVIAGHQEAVGRALTIAKEFGARRAMLLPVSAPFHCDMMMPAEIRLAKDLDEVEFENLQLPLISNVEAKLVLKGEEARRALKLQVSRPVRWYETIRRLLDDGVDTFVEVGPGKVLTGLVRSVDKSVTMLNAEDERSLDQTLAGLL